MVSPNHHCFLGKKLRINIGSESLWLNLFGPLNLSILLGNCLVVTLPFFSPFHRSSTSVTFLPSHYSICKMYEMLLSREPIIPIVGVFVTLPPSLILIWKLIRRRHRMQRQSPPPHHLRTTLPITKANKRDEVIALPHQQRPSIIVFPLERQQHLLRSAATAAVA
jgi:hypothetical protein